MGEWHSKGSFNTQLEGWQNLLPSKETLFDYKIFSLSYPILCLAANKAEARTSSSELQHLASMAGD